MQRWTVAARWAWVAVGIAVAAIRCAEAGDCEEPCRTAEAAFERGRIEEALKIWEHALGYPDDFDPGAPRSAEWSLLVAQRRYARLPGISGETERWEECKRIAWYVSKAQLHGDPDVRRQADELIADFNAGEEGDCYREALLELEAELQKRREGQRDAIQAEREAYCARLQNELNTAKNEQAALQDQLQRALQAQAEAEAKRDRLQAVLEAAQKARMDAETKMKDMADSKVRTDAECTRLQAALEAERAKLFVIAKERENAETKAKVAEEARAKAEERVRSWTALPAKDGLTAGTVQDVTLPGGAVMHLVWCPAGTFMMGSVMREEDRDEDETRHKVEITKGFWLAKTEVTQKQWKSVMGYNPSEFEGDELPVENVTWEDCTEFCRRAGMQLPTEAQWEYACRAGSTGAYAGTGHLKDMGWYAENGRNKTHPVGKKDPNGWGLHDMHGNVEEWCADWYQENLGTDAVTNPPGPATGSFRVSRGGNFRDQPFSCRSAYRLSHSPSLFDEDLGFRPAMVLP